MVLIFKNTTKTELMLGTSCLPGVHPADGLVLACEEHLTPVPVPAAGQHQLCNQSIAISQQRSYRLINQEHLTTVPVPAAGQHQLCNQSMPSVNSAATGSSIKSTSLPSQFQQPDSTSSAINQYHQSTAQSYRLINQEHLTPVPVPAARQHQLCNQSIPSANSVATSSSIKSTSLPSQFQQPDSTSSAINQ